MNQTCSSCCAPFEVTDEDLAFLDSVSPVFNDQKYPIPPPTHCPDCRQQRRLGLCNERHFYPSTCGLCSKRVITEHPPHKNREVYCRECWRGDGWDPCSYGRDFDFDRPFFDQFRELRDAVPAQNLLVEGTNENSEYIHYAGFAKNCYLIMHADFCEDCMYVYGCKKSTSCVDGFYNLQSELLYDCIDCHSGYDLRGCQECLNCSSSAFLRDCVGCQHCFLCTGLREKTYCFQNQQLSKEEYEQKMREIDLGNHSVYQQWKQKRLELQKDHTYKEFQGHNLQNCSGNHLTNCKDTHASFDCEDVDHGKYLYQVVTGAKNVYDIYQYGLNLQESYENSIVGNESYHILFSHNIHVSCSDLSYCWYLQSCKDCFGCTNMHNKRYCILNKQYNQGEYEVLVPRIIEHMRKTPLHSPSGSFAGHEWGELFPISLSPFGYNKTTAQMYYPLDESAVTAKGWQWDHYESPPPDVEKIIPADRLPDSIDDIPDDILNWAITCEETGKAFRITKMELQFYRQQHLPAPRRSPDQRHMDRFALRNPRTLFARPCGKCGKEIETTYAPERPEKVLCEACYLQEVY